MLLLGKIDARRLNGKPENKNNYHSHECKHCVMLIQFQWKVKETYEIKPGGGGRSYHTAHASRHLENYCNEAGRASIQEHLNEKIAERIECEEDVIVKTE